MTKEQRENIKELLSYLSSEEKNNYVTVDITKESNKIAYLFLEKIGSIFIDYTVKKAIGDFGEKKASLHLWEKETTDCWKVNLTQIEKVLNAKWEK